MIAPGFKFPTVCEITRAVAERGEFVLNGKGEKIELSNLHRSLWWAKPVGAGSEYPEFLCRFDGSGAPGWEKRIAAVVKSVEEIC